MAPVFHDIFENVADVIGQFGAPADALDDCELLYAGYTYEDYSGSAFVLYRKGDKLYEVHGGHCSCNGLEDQWEPEETTVEALRMRPANSWPGLDAVIAGL
jgi:hypothetical protein